VSRFGDQIRGAASPRNWQDAASAIRRAKGRGASRFIAQELGISQRQAQRYLAGQVRKAPHGQDIEDLAEPDWLAADALLEAQALNCGHVEVEYNGKSQGVRKVGLISVDGEMREAIEAAAAALLDGDESLAEQLLSDGILGQYSQQNARDDRHILKGTLKISGFRTGFNIL